MASSTRSAAAYSRTGTVSAEAAPSGSFAEFVGKTRRGASPGSTCSRSRADDHAYYRVAHAFVFVRERPEVGSAVLARKFEGATVRALRRRCGAWIELRAEEEPRLGFMLVDGAGVVPSVDVGARPLLEELDSEAYRRVRHAEALERTRKTRELEEVVDAACEKLVAERAAAGDAVRLASLAPLRAQVRQMVMQRLIATRLTEALHKSTRDVEGGAAAAYADASADALVRDEKIWPRLVMRGIAVVDGFLDFDEGIALRREVESVKALGELKQTIQAMSDTRDDRILWLTPNKAAQLGCPLIERVLRTQRGLAHALNSQHGGWCGETLTTPESTMLACYGAGGRYRYHRDNSLNSADGQPVNARALTAIVYANPDWDSARDGGSLRFYDDLDAETRVARAARNHHLQNGAELPPPHEPCEYEPKAGRLVIFDSFHGHEVLKANRDRYALTFWIYADRRKHD